MLLLNRLFSNDIRTWIFSLLMMGLAIFSQAYYKRCKNLKSWRLTYIFPIFLGLFHFLFFSFKGDRYNTWYFFGLFYLSAIICELPLWLPIPIIFMMDM